MIGIIETGHLFLHSPTFQAPSPTTSTRERDKLGHRGKRALIGLFSALALLLTACDAVGGTVKNVQETQAGPKILAKCSNDGLNVFVTVNPLYMYEGSTLIGGSVTVSPGENCEDKANKATTEADNLYGKDIKLR